jgi:hypothetical protein
MDIIQPDDIVLFVVVVDVDVVVFAVVVVVEMSTMFDAGYW